MFINCKIGTFQHVEDQLKRCFWLKLQKIRTRAGKKVDWLFDFHVKWLLDDILSKFYTILSYFKQIWNRFFDFFTIIQLFL